MDGVIVYLSNRLVTKEGYVQKEIRKVLDIALEKPEETIFIIPLRLEECELPRRLRTWHYMDYFPAEQRDRAFQRLLQSLKLRQSQLLSKAGSAQVALPDPVMTSDVSIEQKKPASRVFINRLDYSSFTNTIDILILLTSMIASVLLLIDL